jgi:hypothetical protein
LTHHRWKLVLGAALAGASALLYLVFFAAERSLGVVGQWFLGSLAFLPVQVLLVTLIVDGVLGRRERVTRLKKLNIVIGVFFSEVGHALLAACRDLDGRGPELKRELAGAAGWDPRRLVEAGRRYRSYAPAVTLGAAGARRLARVLTDRRGALMDLMANPSVLEHEDFTDLLWAAFHLAEELSARGDVDTLGEEDAAHLAGDVQRVFPLLISQWLTYLGHLQEDYPYLFSLAARTNPFDEGARVEVRAA